MAVAVDIKLKRANKVYYDGQEMVSGLVVIQGRDTVQHQGISLALEGTVTLQLSSKSVGVFEAFYNSAKPVQLVSSSMEVVKPGKLPSGRTEIPFQFPLKASGSSKVLFETYHGVYVNIQYTLRCEMKRSLLNKDVHKTCEFIVHTPAQPEPTLDTIVKFAITPASLQKLKVKSSLPNFLIKGCLNTTNCEVTRPLCGELLVEHCDLPLKSIDVQLVRVETCGCAEGYARDATEIQNLQIAEGDVCRGVAIPIHMVFPRLFTCPTLQTTNFKIGKNRRTWRKINTTKGRTCKLQIYRRQGEDLTHDLLYTRRGS
ncbi:vacuolar protein sorting-associated protein 26C isoform X3 [Lampetra planeri]